MANEAGNWNQNAPNNGPTSRPQSNTVEETKKQVNEVLVIMQNNITKVLERDEKLHELDDKADALLIGATRFESGAGSLRRKMYWRNLKMKIILGSIIALLLILFIYWIY